MRASLLRARLLRASLLRASLPRARVVRPWGRHLVIAAGLLLGAAAPNPAALPASREATPWWRARHQDKLAELRQGQVDLVFLGDSITQDWEQHGPPAWQDFAPQWQRFYGDRHAVNLGFKGDRTSHLLWRMDHGELDGIQPRVAVVLIGANNLGLAHWTADQTLDGIAAVLADLRTRLPRTQVLLLSVLPSRRSAWVDQTTAAINNGLAERYGRAAADGITYMDVTGVFLRDGQLDQEAFMDRHLIPPDPLLHPTAQAQARLSQAIEPTLARLLGDRVHG